MARIVSDHPPQPAIPARTDVEAIVRLVMLTATAMDGYTSQTRRALDINAHERLALAGLWANGPMTMTELGSWIPLSRAAVTTLVDRLERAGLVKRGSDAADRRRTVVTLVEESLSGVVDLMAPWAADVVALVQEHDDAEWATIANFATRISEVSARHTGRLTSMTDEEIRSLVAQPA